MVWMGTRRSVARDVRRRGAVLRELPVSCPSRYLLVRLIPFLCSFMVSILCHLYVTLPHTCRDPHVTLLPTCISNANALSSCLLMIVISLLFDYITHFLCTVTSPRSSPITPGGTAAFSTALARVAIVCPWLRHWSLPCCQHTSVKAGTSRRVPRNTRRCHAVRAEAA